MTDISFPDMRGKLTQNRPLADLTWLRVGGPADYFYQPADADDLAAFMKALPADVVVMPMGVGSNVIVRDGGLRAMVIRLGRGFNTISCEDGIVTAGAAALDAHVARKAADAGLDLTFLRTIPGSIGGAVRMNAGCYGAYTADYFISADAITRTGEKVTLGPDDLQFAYRQTALPEGYVITAARFAPPKGEAQALHARMEDQLRKRDCHHRCPFRAPQRRGASAARADGGPAAQTGRNPTHQGPQRGVDVPQSGGVFQHGAGG